MSRLCRVCLVVVVLGCFPCVDSVSALRLYCYCLCVVGRRCFARAFVVVFVLCLNVCLVFDGLNTIVFVSVSRVCVLGAVFCVCVLYLLLVLLCVLVSNVCFACPV